MPALPLWRAIRKQLSGARGPTSMNERQGRKNLKIGRGVLENAGLGEVSFFLKKAKQNVLYAAMALEHTDFSSFDELPAIQAKLVKLRDLIAEVSDGIERTEQNLVAEIAEREFAGDSAGGDD